MKQFMGQNAMSRVNCANMLELIREFGQLTRRQLEAATGLSWGGVTNMVNRLISAGYVVERKSTAGTAAGRTPGILEINGDDHFTLGVDVNDTGLSACVLNLKGEVLAEFSEAADFSCPNALLDCIIRFIAKVLEAYASKRILSIGVSMQGEVDGRNGISEHLPQCPGWEHIPLKTLIEERFGLETVLAHDPDCMLTAYLSRSEEENVVLLRLDRSVGMAAALHGEILSGSGLWEAAHMIVDPDGPQCRCGSRGCLEAYVRACGVGRAVSQEALHDLARPLGTAVSNLIRLFRPETLILCGDLMKFQDSFWPQFMLETSHHGVEIRAVADARSAMEGAAALAAKQAIRQVELFIDHSKSK